MTNLKTHLMLNCGMTEAPHHRYHGLCLSCANYALTAGRCPFCRQPVHDYLEVGLEMFV